MAKLDVTRTNVAIERLLDVTENPRHRFLLMSYHRHRFLAMAGRYREIFAPDMMADTPAYHFHCGGRHRELVGKEAVECLYRMWADTNQSVFVAEREEVAVADHFIASILTIHQQVWSKTLTWNRAVPVLPGFLSESMLENVLSETGRSPDEDATYLYTNVIEMIWRFDDRGRLAGKDVWEPEPEKADIVRLDPADVLTTEEAAGLLRPLIRSLPPFEEAGHSLELAVH